MLNNSQLLELGVKGVWTVNGYLCELLGNPQRKNVVLYCEKEDMMWQITWNMLETFLKGKTFNITL